MNGFIMINESYTIGRIKPSLHPARPSVAPGEAQATLENKPPTLQ